MPYTTTTYRRDYIQRVFKEDTCVTNPIINNNINQKKILVCECCNKPLTKADIHHPQLDDSINGNLRKQDNIDELNESLACSDISPNRYLKNLETRFPDLFQRLNKIPPVELMRRLEVEAYRTAYRKAYCAFPKYPHGIYISWEQEEDKLKNGKSMIIKDGYSSQFTKSIEDIKNIKKVIDEPKPIYFGNKAPIPVYSEERAKTKQKPTYPPKLPVSLPCTTEYRQGISKTGCIIVRNRLHDHSKCHGKCIHPIVNPCKKYQ